MAKRRRRKRKAAARQRNIIIASIAAVVVVAAIALGFGIRHAVLKNYVNKVAADTIQQNIHIGDIDVSGMKKEQALEALRAKEAEYQAIPLVLEADGEEVEITLGDLGLAMQEAEALVEEAVAYAKEGSISSRYKQIKKLNEEAKEIALDYQIDSDTAKAVIEEKISPLEKSAKDATLKRENGSFVITDEVKGKAIQVEASLDAILDYFAGDWKTADGVIEMVSEVDEPNVTRAQLEEVQDILGTYTTYCGVSGGRVQNIEAGSGHINGALLLPGEEYSANAAMEPYTEENGFTNAGSYENGKVVQSMGGGICQVSSTLYNALILAEIEITERAAHSMTVSYVDPSMDAAIAGTWKDLKFKNNQDTPIYVEAYISGGNLTFNIYGKETRAANRTVTYESEVTSRTEPEKQFEATSSGSFGTITKVDSGHTGMKAKLWKIVKEDGVEVSRDVVNNSSYMASDATYSVSVNTDNSEAKKLVQNAIKTQDEAKIESAIAKAKQVIADAKKAQQEKEEAEKEEAPVSEVPDTAEEVAEGEE